MDEFNVRETSMIEFNDLKPLYGLLAPEIEEAIARVLKRGCFVLGPEVEAFEAAFARYHGVEYAIGTASGTDAIELALRAAGIGPGDEVITVSHTAVATVCAIERAGAKPVLVDVDPETYTMDPAAARAAVTTKTRALVPVHLYGHPADMGALRDLAERHNLLLIEDCAQAHGARYAGQVVGTFGHASAFSFYPTKNLGGCGDGGTILTRDAKLAARLRRLRQYGQVERGRHAERGVNSRLDEIQAAILSVKLAHLDEHNAWRRRLARHYRLCLKNDAAPVERDNCHHVYHLFVVRQPRREMLLERLRRQGIGTLIHYPIPIHLQSAYSDLGYRAGSLPVTERLVKEIVSLPLYVGLQPNDIERIAIVVNESVKEVRRAG